MSYILHTLTAVLVVLKVIEFTPTMAAMSWWLVFAPSLLVVAFTTFILTLMAIFAVLASK